MTIPRCHSDRPPRVLIVDDEYTVRTVLSAALRRQGFDTRLAAGGAEAVALLRHEGAFDLALIDLRMPGMDGLATAAALTQVSPRLRCCLLTGGEAPSEEDLRAAGIACILSKPVSTETLSRGLTKCLSGDKPTTALRREEGRLQPSD